jgi:hypothetical protein
MARAHSPNGLLRGKIGNQIYRVVNGKQVVSMAPPPWQLKRKHKRRMRHTSKYLIYQQNIHSFTGASKTIAEIYNDIRIFPDSEVGHIMRPYPQNHLLAQLKLTAGERIGEHATEYTARDIQRALSGLDLSKDSAPAKAVQMIPIGPHHNPTAIKILGLEKAANLIPMHGNARLEIRFFIRQAMFSERRFDANTKTWSTKNVTDDKNSPCYNATLKNFDEPSDWIPTEFIPSEGFTLDLPTYENDLTFITTIYVEWREIRAVGRKVHRRHDVGIVRIASVHGPAAAFYAQGYTLALPKHNALPAGQFALPKRSHQSLLRPTKQVEVFLEIHRITDPQAFVKNALAKLKPK